MSRYIVNYTTNELYAVEIEADSESEALQKVTDGEFEESQADHEATEFLGATTCELIEP